LPPLLFLAYAAGLFVAGPLLDLRLGTPLRLPLRPPRIGLRLHPFVLESPQLSQREQDRVLWTVGLRWRGLFLRQHHLGRLSGLEPQRCRRMTRPKDVSDADPPPQCPVCGPVAAV